MSKRSTHNILLLATLASAVLFVLPVRWVLLPLLYFNTFVHELCHAAATVLTGGRVLALSVHADGSGLTHSIGGWGWLIASAGYVGASAIGAGLILAGRTVAGARKALGYAVVIIAVALLLWLRGDQVGIMMAIIWLFGLLVASRVLDGDALRFACQFLGIQQCLNALSSLWVLWRISAQHGVENDAVIAQQMTGLPAMLWATVWVGFSLVLMGLALHRSWREATSSSRAG